MSDFFDGPPPDRPPATANEKAIVVVISGALLIFFGIDLVRDFNPVKLSVPFILISWAALLAIHEFGHALAARAVGWGVDVVSLGFGKVRWRRVIGGLPVEIRTFPVSGFIIPRPLDLVRPQLKDFIVSAAGPGVELLLVVAIAAAVGFDRLTTLTESISMIAIQSFCVAALWGAITNLIPFGASTEHGQSASDGLRMLMCWRQPDSHYAAQMKS